MKSEGCPSLHNQCDAAALPTEVRDGHMMRQRRQPEAESGERNEAAQHSSEGCAVFGCLRAPLRLCSSESAASARLLRCGPTAAERAAPRFADGHRLLALLTVKLRGEAPATTSAH